MTARGWHCLRGQWGWHPAASAPGGWIMAPQLAGSRGLQPEPPHGYWAQLACMSKAAKLPYSWREAAFSPKCSQRSWEERQGRRAALRADLERYPLSIRPHTGASDLSFFLVMPVQRVTKYPLLLGKILENTPTSASAYPALQAAVRAMAQVNANINEYKRRREVGERVGGTVRAAGTASGKPQPNPSRLPLVVH